MHKSYRLISNILTYALSRPPVALPGGQLWAAALHGSRFVAGARNVLSVWEDAAQITSVPTYQLVGQIGSALLDDIRGLALDDHFFYLATKSGKIHLWPAVPISASQNPVLTLTGSGPFGHLFSDGEYLCAVRPEPPTGVDIFRVADLAAGNVQPFKVINNGPVRLNQASQAATENGVLFVASRGDHRVLCWKTPADWGNPATLVVLGQPDAQNFDAAIGQNRLFMPNSLLPRAGELWVGEFKFSSRILKFSAGSTPALDAPPVAEIRAFPNPFSDRISLKNARTEAVSELWDVFGRLVFRGKNIGQADFSALPAGVYFLKIDGASPLVLSKTER